MRVPAPWPQYLCTTLLLLLAVVGSYAGGGPQNVLLVVNSRSKESLEIGNAYRRARNLPYRQVLTLNTSPAFVVPYQQYLDEIETPVRTYLKNQQLEEQITCLALTRGVPQMVQIANGRATASLLAAMNLPERPAGAARVANPYLAAPTGFARRSTAIKGMYLVTTLTGFHTRDVQALIAQSVAADGTAPAGRFVLQTSPQLSRSSLADAVELLKARGLQADVLAAPPADKTGIMAYLSGGVYSGLSKESIQACTFQPGALADMAQGFGAAPQNFDETAGPVLLPVSAFIQAGVTGAHGVVGDAGMEALPLTGNLRTLLDRYTSGFSLGESFYAALPYLNWQNLVIGDPLCTPYAKRPVVTIETNADPLKGMTPVKVTASSANPGTTISRIDLYVDDRFVQTLYEPDQARIVLRIGEQAVSYAISRGATLRTLLEGLADTINGNTVLADADGVRAVPSPHTGSLQLIARTPGADGNDIQVSLVVDSEKPAAPGVTARLEETHLRGGGKGPQPARATLSFLGRRIKPGDEVSVQIQQERVSYTVPEGGATLAALIAGLAARIEANAALQKPNGVRAYADPKGMPYLVLEARTPGESGNATTFQLTVKATADSQLRGYPETPSHLHDGHDGSAASVNVFFALGEATARGTYLLDTGKLADGYHRLRAVAFEGSPAQVQGWKEAACLLGNLEAPPLISLPEQLGPVTGEVLVPVTASETTERVDVYVDGQLLGSTDTAPFTMRIPAVNLGRGTHDLWAEGIGKDGVRYVTAPIPLEVQVAPEVTRVTPDHTVLAGGTTHRIIGTGFQPNCTVRLAGIPARTVTYFSPNLLEVVSDAGAARRGWVEVTNPDTTAGTLLDSFEYYTPRVADVQITPSRDVLGPGRTAQFSAACFDQFGHAIPATVNWSVTGGRISTTGLYLAPTQPGAYLIRASHPDGPEAWEVPVTVGPTPVADGRVRHWLLLGPYPDPDGSGLETALLPETTLLPSHGEQTGPGRWQSYAATSDFIDLEKVFTQTDNAVAYAHIYLLAPVATDGTLVFGSDDGIRMWLNGTQIYSLRTRRAADPNQGNQPITLVPGWNRLLVKVDQGVGEWGFYLRLQTRDGKPLTGISYALDRPLDLK